MATPQKIINHTGKYMNWNVYNKAVAVCDLTEVFINRFIIPSNLGRTADQMRQAARSCKQNIVEGSCAAAVSRETEIKLTGVAKASLQELAEDYRDYLRQHSQPIWELCDERTQRTRWFLKQNQNPEFIVETCRNSADHTIANIMLTMICQLDFMLRTVIERAEKIFIEEGGIRERMSAVRRGYRNTPR
ncbi:MAG: four helix bundle suffix domain-containing protein [Muribaculaceae bacterium]|nr:four helix bundle suffix domain-containing protein [Muribaculaceae bacterium]